LPISTSSTPSIPERILDRFVRATFAIDSAQRLLYSNAAARRLTQSGVVTKTPHDRLTFTDRALNERVAEHLVVRRNRARSLVLRTVGIASDPTGAMYRVLITPLDDASDTSDGLWMVFVSEPRAERNVHSEVLRQVYGLTRTESLLVARLFAGESLGTSAETLRISVATARTHLRQVFRKCAVQSQGELLQLVALGPRNV